MRGGASRRLGRFDLLERNVDHAVPIEELGDAFGGGLGRHTRERRGPALVDLEDLPSVGTQERDEHEHLQSRSRVTPAAAPMSTAAARVVSTTMATSR